MAGILDKKPHLAPSCLLHHPYIFLSLFLFFQDHSPTQPCFRGRPGRRGEGFLERKIETLQNKMARVDSLTLKWFALVTLLTVSSSDLAYPQPQEDGLVINGDFETVPTGGFAGDGVLSDGPTSIPGWRLNGTVELVESGQKQGGMILIVPEGRHAIRLGNDAEIRQDLKVEKGALYSITFSAARTCAQLESLNVSVPPGSVTIDLQTLYNIQGWDAYASAFQAEEENIQVVFRNPGMEDDPTCGPIIDDIAVKKLFTPEKPKGNAVLNGDFEEGPWMFRNESLGVLLPTNLDDQTSSLPGWIVESNRAVRYIDSYHFSVPEGKRAIELLSGKEGIISQMVETKPDKEYRLSFALGHAGDSCKQPLAIMAFAGDQSQNVHYTPNSNSTFQVADVNFTAKAERTRIAFYSIYYNTRSDDMSSLCGPVVDDVRVALSRSVVSGEVGRVVGLLGLCLLLLVLG